MDRTCDACGVRTVVTRYELHGRTLTMCGHHSRENEPALRRAGWFAYRLVELARA